MATFTSAAYDGRYLQLTVTETVNVVANTSTLNWTLTSAGGNSAYYTIDETTVTLNGVQVYNKARTQWDDRVFPAAKGSTSGSLTVAHNTDGTKSITVGFSTRVYVYGSVDYGGTMTLTNIDRTAPTVSFTTSSITASGFTISASSSATADIWQYSTDNGSSWTQFSTTAGTSASKTITNLSPNTSYTVKVRARKQTNQVYGTSSASTVKTLGGTVINSVNTVTADNSSVSITLNATVYDASYTNTLVIKNGSTSYLTISGLTWSKGTASRTINLSAAQRTTLLTAMASVKSFTGTFAVTTYSGTTQIGSTSTATATVQTTSTNSAPTISGFTYIDSNGTTVEITGNNQLFVQGYSTLYVTPGTATAKNNATISSYTVTCNGKTASNTTGAALSVGTITSSGNISVVLTVTDSRGYTASSTQTVTVIAYAKPTMQSVSVRRTNDIEAEMQLVFNGTISAISVNSTQKNALQTVRYRYKLTSATSYGSYTSILSSVTRNGTSYSYSNLEVCSLDSSKSYDFHLQITDKLSTLDLYFVIPQGTPLLALRKQKIGINTPNPEAALHVVGNAKITGTTAMTGRLTASGGVTVGASILPSSTASYNLGSTTATMGTTYSKFHRAYYGGTQYGYFGVSNVGTADTDGYSIMCLGNNTASGTAGNSYGRILLYGTSTGYHYIQPTTANTSGYTHYLPNSSGFLVTSSNSAAVGGTAKPVYISDAGVATALSSTVGGSTRPVYLNAGTVTALTSVAVAYGGTGATTAAAARTNLGVAVTSLYSGTLTTGSTTFNYGNYNAYIIIGQPTTSSARLATIIPKAVLTTSDVTYQFADEVNYYSFKLKYSGTTVTLTFSSRSSSGQILNIYGIN